MNLTLEVVSPNARDLGAACRRTFSAVGGRIGRAPDCDWVLGSPYVSRHHATVHYIDGGYFIEPMGENGVGVNRPDALLPQMARYSLKDGDRLFIDEYEITVSLPVAQAASAFAPAASASPLLGDPFAPAPSAGPRLSDPFEPSGDDLDPLKHITARVPSLSNVTAPRQQTSWNHSSSLDDHFTPPVAPLAAPPPMSGGGIPDDWDKTSFGRRPPEPPRTPPPAAAPAIPDDWDKTSFGRPRADFMSPPGAAPVPPSVAQPPRPAPPTHAPRVPPSVTAPPPSATTPPASGPVAPAVPPPARVAAASGASAAPPVRPGVRTPVWPIPSESAPASKPVTSAPPASPAVARPAYPAAAAAGAAEATAGGNFDVDNFLRSAGVDPASLAPETAESLGYILRTVIQGVIDVLQARAEIKGQFHLPVTVVKRAENNPLKFAVNAEDALNTLLGRRNPAYLAPIDAFEDAFDDIRFHQLAMLAGMRAGFEAVMERFDPERLQADFDRRGKAGLLAMASKARYWELYGEMFSDLAADRDKTFRRLFGEDFASAYEKQLEGLKRSRKRQR
jgi:type VI secretion system FHA domain protein